MSGETPGPGIGMPDTVPPNMTWAQVAVLLALGYALPFITELINRANSGKPVTLADWEMLIKLNARTYESL
jgi:type III secretory pathway component EscR